eukprot:2758954-Prorocentrum_lima.AAC.1
MDSMALRSGSAPLWPKGSGARLLLSPGAWWWICSSALAGFASSLRTLPQRFPIPLTKSTWNSFHSCAPSLTGRSCWALMPTVVWRPQTTSPWSVDMARMWKPPLP